MTIGTGLTRYHPEPLETEAAVEAFMTTALAQNATGLAVPFAILTQDGTVAGSTRYLALAPEHRRLEIGHTFVGAAWQRTAVNTAAKLLMLAHAFEQLGCFRVELKTDARNAASRAAILRLGAREEGMLRSHMICADGHRRDTIYFSILESEWPAVKTRLTIRLAAG